MYEVKQKQLKMGRVLIANVNVNHSIGIATIVIPFDLPNPALYAVVLEVKDVANNVKQARRFVMFDNSSKVFARDNIPLYSTTATDSTDRKWQTNHGDLCYSWIGRYYNDKFNDLNLLQPIKPDYHGHISGIYEQNSGILPVSGTENIDGITNFYFSLANDTKIIFNNETVPNFTSQKICLSLPLCDGETYRFNVVAQDIMFHAYSEHIYTHIDSSEPEIFDIGLEKDDYQLLNVHNSSDLSKMVLKFNALDIHSGLHSVAWSLGTSFGGNDIGNGSLGIVRLTRNESCLEHSNCYCPSVGPCAYFNFTLMLNSLVHLNTHKGNHNRAYHFTISVTNEARLSYVEHKEVLADDSPPAIGVVREGSLGGLDIDYTSKETVIAHWDGFIDHESGIRSYRVGLARWCLEEEAFRNNKTSGVLETTIIDTIEKSARLTLTEEGQYFVTVVAYNNAMELSNPVCSDGVVLDRTPPVVVNVTIQSASVTEAMVCSDEKAWYVTRNLTRYVVRDDHCNKLCRNTSSNDFLLLLPVEASREPYQSSSCLISDSHVTIYLPIDLIHLQWNILELGSQIHDVYIGIGSTKESSASPDLIDYHKAPHTYRYKKRHVGLSDSDEIYIFLKITNSAALTTISTIGPVILHVFNKAGYHCTVNTDTFHLPSQSPPGHGVVYDVTSDITSYFDRKQDIDVAILPDEFCITWEGFDHYGDIEFQLGLGKIPGSDDILPFHVVPNIEIYCENAKNLSLYRKNFVTVRAITSGGSVLAISDGFTIINSSDITDSVRVYDGHGCTRTSRARMELKVGTTYIYIPSETTLHIGHTYTLASNISKCQKMPLYPHVDILTCVEVYCPVGSIGVICVPLAVTEDPNVFDKVRLYEVDSDADDIRHNKDLFYATNIGDKMAWLHGAELDFTKDSVRPGGIILGMGDRPICWYLVRDSHNFSQPCEENPNCVASVVTLGGFSVFQGVNLEHEIMYFICAITKINEDAISSFQTCGNGFVIDVNPPSTGEVTIASEKGFLVEKASLIVHWTGFQDFHGYQTLGYPTSIARFTYSIGSNPHGQDVVAETDVGLYESVKIHNPSLHTGEVYYATVTAFDQVGHSTSAVSRGVMYDNTAPVTGAVQVGTYLKSTDIVAEEINVHLIGFHDNESGISKIRLGIGSTQHIPDVLNYQDYVGEFASLSNFTALHDGHHYYVIILVTNGAGLSSVAASDEFVVDRSAPTEGVVRDGRLSADVDFQANTTHSGCHWSGFSDPHSGIRYYSAGLGTVPLMDDVRPLSFTGTKTEVQWTFNFVPGSIYYCTVQACNGAGLCSSVSSNGFTTDNSPPLPGIVHVGLDGHHSRFWAHANSIQVQWFGFVDVESGIQNYEVCVRHTNNSECDILSFINVFLSNTMTHPVRLPRSVSLTVEVRAYNPLNMSTKSVSDSFIVDTTPPVLVTSPVLGVENRSSNVVTVQTDPSVIMLKWKFADEESPIVKQMISVRTHEDGHTPIKTIYLSGETAHTITLDPNNWMRSGDTYTAIVTACNEAGLCTSSKSNELLVDSTPPHLGGFKEPLHWHISSYSQETLSFVNLTLYGFKDIESGIKSYYVTVGDTYSGSEISDGVLTFLPSGSDGESEEIQLILTEHIQQGQHLILSLWAENNAGLLSNTGKVTVTAIVSSNMRTFGYLEILKHSCDAHYCNKECTCAVISQKCHEVDVDVDCKENNQTDDYDVKIDIPFDGQYNHQEFLATSACISANWIVTGIRGQDIKRMEWSMGQLGMPVGTGVFDPLLENQWHDVGKGTYVTHCLLRGNHLLHNTKYVVYVRAWTSTSDYTVFTSHPAHIDNTYPSVRKGKYITENQKRTCSYDVDFTTTLDTVTACWTGVFTDPQSGIRTHQVALGTIPGGDDVVPFKNVGINTSMSWDNLSLSPGTKYFVTVTCINNVGLLNTLVSDGFIVDNERPYAGIVYNTDRFNNAHVQKSRDIGVSFRGFHDRHSAIKSYSVAFDKSYANFTTENKSLVFQNIGLRNTFKFYNTSLVTGQWYRFAVKARDSAGFESEMVFSPPAMFDSTPPVHINISSISVMEEVTSLNGTLYWVKSLDGVKGPTVYKLHISSVNITSSNVFEVSFENEKQIHPVTIERDGICTAAISFISSPFYFGNRSLSVLARGIPLNTTLDFTLSISDDVTVTGQIDNVIEVQQVSPTELKINTHIMDAESGVRDIYVGENRMKRTLYNDDGIKGVETPYILLDHGADIFARITCWNSANLQKFIMLGSKTVTLFAPEVTNARIAFETAWETYSGLPVMLSSSEVIFSWEIFDDTKGINGYSYRICQGTQHVTDWKNTELRNYASLDHALLLQDDIYTVEVKACDNGEMFCQAVNGSFLISGKSPTLTGLHPTVTRVDSGVLLTWDDVFNVQSELLPRYTVTAGTDVGYSDLLRLVKTTDRQVSFKDFNGSDVFVSITCSYVTGLFTTFRGKVATF
ncbi:uncharacterized protein LOC117332160 [Pecten maximus]|uniref:uncharacterized protein LOC117332160 n=1 Tax=Pecten maximus TaxID=6579 RepID=UPI0014585AF8|nr:uncharacterized protein LOC117332160 [Pecten maximus]